MIASQNKIMSFINRHKSGVPVGLTSVCSSNWFVIKAAILNAKENKETLLIESTSNQVNQFGGYTGFTPEKFRENVFKYVRELNFPENDIILGGDHLGPNVWQKEESGLALKNASDQIASYVSAGFSKIHLDASMKCIDDGDPALPLESPIIAERAALLCKRAETTYENLGNARYFDPPVYVIGTDVPPPGGAKSKHNSIRITPVDEVEETIRLTKKAFEKYGLEDAWNRVIAVVVQPGVEFGDSVIFEYQPDNAIDLVKKIESIENLIYEAHSTDYQRKEILRRMVKDHFAILKVGPWLTYAFREAIYALALIEKEFLLNRRTSIQSGLLDVIDYRMIQNPVYWKDFYFGNEDEIKFARKYSYSDRIRYYWTDEIIAKALTKLIENLEANEIPSALLSQFMPEEYSAFRDGKITKNPEELIIHKIRKVLDIYYYATKGEN